jgi:excisionase family DNA binding protein
MDRLLTPKQLSELLQVSLSTIYKWAHYKYVPYVKIGDLIRFKEKKVEEWLMKRERKGRVAYKCNIALKE